MRQGHDEGQSHDRVTAGDVLTTRELRAVGASPDALLSALAHRGRRALASRRGVGVGTLAKLDAALRSAKLRWWDAPVEVARTPAQVEAVKAVVDVERAVERARAALLRCPVSPSTARMVGVHIGTALAQIEAAADLVVPDAVEVTT